MRKFDVICLGRAAVDLYSEQHGTPLEDAGSFKKYLGGSSGNMAFGAARQGLKVAMLTRVGNDHMGRFVLRQLQSVGVDTSMTQTDPSRLTGLVILGMRNAETFPLIFYRNNCADMAIEPTFSEEQIASSRVLVITGTHFSSEAMRAVSLKAIEYARNNGVKVVVDIDYRPVLWGIGKIEDGESRFAESREVTNQLQKIIALCDVLVGTEEELHIGGGDTNTLVALQAVRAVSNATIVLKRGALGCQVFTSAIPNKLSDVPIYGGVQVEVLNVLGAGDAFISGLLRGYIKENSMELNDGKEKSRNFLASKQQDIDWRRAANFANACGAIVVSRHACAPAIPTKEELDYFIANRSNIPRPDKSGELQHLHRTSTRNAQWNSLAILAFDHRAQFVEMVSKFLPDAIASFKKKRKIESLFLKKIIAEFFGTEKTEVSKVKEFSQLRKRDGESISEEVSYILIKHLKRLIFSAFEVAVSDSQLKKKCLGKVGLLCDHDFGKEILAEAVSKGYWLASPVEKPKVSPLAFEHADVGLAMRQWSQEIVAKCLVFVRSGEQYTSQMHEKLLQLWEAVLKDERELLLEVIVEEGCSLVEAIENIYSFGVRPDWWKITVDSKELWDAVAEVVRRNDPYCRGVLMLGLDGTSEEVNASLFLALQQEICKGFAVGRTFFSKPSVEWLSGKISDDVFVQQVSKNYSQLASAIV